MSSHQNEDSTGWQLKVTPYTLQFKRPAGTSRGVYTNRKVWYLTLSSPLHVGRVGIGECAPLPQLSCDDRPDYEEKLQIVQQQIEQEGRLPSADELIDFPSIAFGIKSAWLHLKNGSPAYASTPFARGEEGIPINGLIWMGEKEYMYRQIVKKIEDGFRCIKIKIGSIDFEDELALLRYIRKHFSREDMELRVDANGAFSPDIALEYLKRLSDYDLHSIEQPIRAGQWEAFAKLIEQSPLPIALDEELIGHNRREEKEKLLDCLNPHYIILKPSLHGGADKWVELATERNIGWWATSALESNIGLNAIAQWVSTYPHDMPQGLGTGLLFEQNFNLPLYLNGDKLWYGGSQLPKEEQIELSTLY